MNHKLSKNIRTLYIYAGLCEGKVINKSEEARKFGVDERSIQRDIDDIRTFLDERIITDFTDTRMITYDRSKKGFIMTGDKSTLMDNSEVLAVSKILLDSRAFTKEEITIILDKLLLGCVPKENMRLAADLMANERYHYVELHHKSHIKDKLWELGSEINQCNLLEITYYRQTDSKTPVKRCIQPISLLFSEYYFYLNAYIVEKNEHEQYVRQYDYPTIFRIDRIKEYKELGEKFRIPYVNRFEEGEFRKRIQFMYAGELIRLQFCYSGKNVEAILDRLPTAKVVSESESGKIIEAEVYGKGILMWLLSQGKMVEVLKPESLRAEIKEILLEMIEKYD